MKLAGVLTVLALEALRDYITYACKQTDSVARRACEVRSEAGRRASRREDKADRIREEAREWEVGKRIG